MATGVPAGNGSVAIKFEILYSTVNSLELQNKLYSSIAIVASIIWVFILVTIVFIITKS